jgi:hypothetical protein
VGIPLFASIAIIINLMTKIRASRLKFSSTRSVFAIDNKYLKRRLGNTAGYLILACLVPYASVKTFNLLDRLPYWDNRVSYLYF